MQTSNPQTKSHNVMNGPNAADPKNVVKLIIEATGSTACRGSTHRCLPSCSGCGGAASGAAACADVFSAAAAADAACECVGECVFKTGASAALPPAERLHARMAMTRRNTSPAPAVQSANGNRALVQLVEMANSLAISTRMYETFAAGTALRLLVSLTAMLCPIPGAVGQGDGGTVPISTSRPDPERSVVFAADVVGLGPMLDAFAGPRPGACRARGAVSCHASTWPRLDQRPICLGRLDQRPPPVRQVFFPEKPADRQKRNQKQTEQTDRAQRGVI